jgi:hypothetical protein
MTKVINQKQSVLFLGSEEFVNLTIRITGKNDCQTSAIKTEVLLTYQDLYNSIHFIL